MNTSELRLYLRRGGELESSGCAWALLDEQGQLRSSGVGLKDDVPRAGCCRLVLQGELVLSLKLPLPDLPERRLAPLLAAAAESATLSEAEDLHAAFMGRAEDGEAVLAVVDDAWLRQVLDRLSAYGLYPEEALPDYLLLPWQTGDWTVAWRGNESVLRLGPVQGMALDGGEPPVALRLALDQSPRPNQIRVFQASQMGGGDWANWRKTLNLPLELAGAWDWRTAPWPELPNLLQGGHSPARVRVDWSRLARPLLSGALLIAGIQLAGMALDWGLLSREQADIQREMASLASQSLPAHATVVDPAWQVAQQLRSLKSAAGHPSGESLAGLLGGLGRVWPPTGAPRMTSMSYESGSGLTIALAASEANWLEQVKASAASQHLEVVASNIGQDAVQLNIRQAKEELPRGQ